MWKRICNVYMYYVYTKPYIHMTLYRVDSDTKQTDTQV